MHGLFGTKHLIILAICFVLIPVAYYFARKLKFEKMAKIMLFVGIISEIIKIFYYTVRNEDTLHGVLPKSDLPFHLCSIQILFIVVLNVSQNQKLKDMLISFMMPSCLIGGLAALLIATDSARNGAFIITLQYFLYHVAIMVFALYLMTSKEHAPTLKGYYSCLKMLLIMMFVAFYINSLAYDSNVIGDGKDKINFMYVAGPPQQGLPYLNEDGGWLSYIIKYAILVIVCVSLFYVKPIVLAATEKIRSLKNKSKGGSDSVEATESVVGSGCAEADESVVGSDSSEAAESKVEETSNA